MKNIFLLACLSSPLVASAIGFEVLPESDGISQVRYLNHRGDYVGFGNGLVIARIAGQLVVQPLSDSNGTPISTSTIAVSENGWLYGYSGTYSNFTAYNSVVARPGEGWRRSPTGQSTAVGVTASGKVLQRIGTSGIQNSWWDPVTNTVTPGAAVPSFAMACNLAGDAIYDLGGWYGRAGQTPFQLSYQGWDVTSWNLNDQGDVAGGAMQANFGVGSTRGLVWDRNGNVVISVPLLNTSVGSNCFRDVNNRRQAGGTTTDGTGLFKAVYYSSETGLISLNDYLVPASSAYSFSSIEQISDNGLILAFGRGPGDTTGRRYLLRVVPEPASMAALGVGLLGVLRSRRRRRRQG